MQADPSADKISHHEKILLIGSCFANNIGSKLQKYKFQADINPFGILYNPISIAQNLLSAAYMQEADPEKIVQGNGRFFHYDFHSEISGSSEMECLQKAHKSIQNTHGLLDQLDYLFISLGTAWAYELKGLGSVVANCHKLPANNFKKVLLKQDQIEKKLTTLIETFQTKYPDLKIIFTLSPVRHVKDGLHENQVSKSILMLVVHSLTQQYSTCSYFPSYEIMMDDLRDYRYYADDLIHPSKLALDYIWKYFSETYFSIATFQLVDEIHKINRDLSHKAFHPKTEEHQKFLQKLEGRIKRLSRKHNLDFSKEIETLIDA